MKLFSETRWVERHSTMAELKILYPHILRSLESMTVSTSDWDAKTATDAGGLLKYLKSSSFVAAFIITEHMLGYTYQLSKKLQGQLLPD